MLRRPERMSGIDGHSTNWIDHDSIVFLRACVVLYGIANALGVHRSVINRQMRGRKDMSLGRVAELAHLLGYEAEFELTKPTHPAGSNAPQENVGIMPFNQTQAFLDANKAVASAASRVSEYKLEMAS